MCQDKKIEDLMVGGLKIIQSKNLYRFTSDSVMLARYPNRGGGKVLDLCAGSGVVGLHFYGEYGAEKLTFVEVQESLASMCKESISLNNLDQIAQVICCNLKDYDGKHSFDMVFCNPPYKKADSGILPQNPHIALCRTEVECTLDDIVLCSKRALKPGGSLFMCHKPERLTDLLVCLRKHKLEPIRLAPVKGKGKNSVYLFLIEAISDRNPPLVLEDAIINNAVDFKG